MRGRIIAIGAAFTAAIVILAACEVIFPLKVAPNSEPDADDQPDVIAVTEAGADGPIACVHAVAPQPPTGDDSASIPPFVLAVNFLDLDAGTGAGLDLDGLCTCYPKDHPDDASCTTFPTTPCDGPGGRDNTGTAAFRQMDSFLNISRAGSINKRISLGKFTYLLLISDYNGKSDDPSVYVGAMTSDGILLDDAGDKYGVPQWDGGDEWSVDTNSATSLQADGGGYNFTPASFTTGAYVASGTLVAHMPKFNLGFSAGKIIIPDLLIVGALSASGLDGQLVGRMPVATVLGVFTHFKDQFNAPLCPGNGTFDQLHDEACQTADLMSNPSADRTGMACDALSIALPFTALPAKLSFPWTDPDPPSLCEGGIDASCAR